jgi:hypothetical protein
MILDNLIKAVETGDYEEVERMAENLTITLNGWHWNRFSTLDVLAAANGSVDTAINIMENWLPGWIWGRQVNGAMWVAKRPYGTIRVLPVKGNCGRALVIAILKAKQAEGRG